MKRLQKQAGNDFDLEIFKNSTRQDLISFKSIERKSEDEGLLQLKCLFEIKKNDIKNLYEDADYDWDYSTTSSDWDDFVNAISQELPEDEQEFNDLFNVDLLDMLSYHVELSDEAEIEEVKTDFNTYNGESLVLSVEVDIENGSEEEIDED